MKKQNKTKQKTIPSQYQHLQKSNNMQDCIRNNNNRRCPWPSNIRKCDAFNFCILNAFTTADFYPTFLLWIFFKIKGPKHAK